MGKAGIAAWGAPALLAAAAASCAKSGTVSEKHPVTVDLAQYRTVSLDVEPANMPDPEPDTSAFEDYLAGRLRDEGVLSPLEMMDPGTPDLTVRVRVVGAKQTRDEADVKLDVTIVETRSGDEIGELDVTGHAAESGERDLGGRRAALHHAADEIASYLEKRRSAGGREGSEGAPPPAKPAPPSEPGMTAAEDPFRAQTGPRQPICASSCTMPESSALPETVVQRVTTAVDSPLQALRACLDRVGANNVEPAMLLRFGAEGELVGVRIDLGGYEDLLCVDPVRTHPPRVRVPRASMVRCVFHCS